MCSLVFLREKLPQATLPSYTGRPPDVFFFGGGGEQFSGGTLEVIVLSRARACNGDRAIQSQFTV